MSESSAGPRDGSGDPPGDERAPRDATRAGDGEGSETSAGLTSNGAAPTPGTRAADDAREFTFDDVAVVMGTYDEEAAVGDVLRDVARVTDGRAEVVVVDSSSDRTPEIAADHGARVIRQPPRGYGHAVRQAVLAPDRPVVVTTDCDDTYPMEALPRFLDLVNDGYDVVSGDRLYRGAAAMPDANRWGNRAFAALSSVLVGRRFHDVTTGMRAYRRELLEEIRWTENTGLSAELLLRPVARGYDVIEVPIDYRERAGETTLDPLAGGAAIAGSIVKVAAEERLRRVR